VVWSKKKTLTVRYLLTAPPEVFPASQAALCPVHARLKPLLYLPGSVYFTLHTTVENGNLNSNTWITLKCFTDDENTHDRGQEDSGHNVIYLFVLMGHAEA